MLNVNRYREKNSALFSNFQPIDTITLGDERRMAINPHLAIKLSYLGILHIYDHDDGNLWPTGFVTIQSADRK